MHQKVSGKVAYTVKETIRFCSAENDNTFTVEPGADVTVRAGSQIRLLPGFHAKAGSNFNAIIDTEICNTTIKKNATVINNERYASNYAKDFQTNDKADNNSNIQIYPNPNDGSFIIDFGSDSFYEYRLMLTNIEGKPVISINEINSSAINLVIKDYPKGVYILYLFNDKNKDIFTHKIIYQ